jgi:ribose transport system ATP-binding protein
LVDQVKREARRVDAEGRPVGSANATNGTGAAALSGDPLLVMQGISKHFGGTQALDQVGLQVSAGEIVALLGENGAGKSTLIKILASVYTLDQGSVSYRGREATSMLRRLPISFIHQDLGLIDLSARTEFPLLENR